MKLRASLLSACLVLSSAASAFAAQVTLTADAHVNAAHPTSNYGTLSNLYVGNGSTSLLQFELASLPTGTTASQVSRATLTVFVNRVLTPGTVSLSPVTSTWTESGVTFATLPSIGAASSTVTAPVAGQYLNFDVTALVQGWITAPATNFGFALTSAAGNILIDSKESDETAHSARLDISIVSQGPIGPAGSTGIAGPVGLTGTTGATGAVGATGVTGAQGIAGVAGVTGATGAVGSTGATGAAGATGVTGAQGIAGVTGSTGATGLAGATGTTGATGALGTTGSTGATGLAGATGAAGSTGVNFTGAYSAATTYQKNDVVTSNSALYIATSSGGFSNIAPPNAAFWAVLLPQGATGATGPVGPPGAPSTVAGPSGAAGPTGATGPAGSSSSTPQPNFVNFTGAYSSGFTYALSDAVTYNGFNYYSLIASNLGNTPDTSTSSWARTTPDTIYHKSLSLSAPGFTSLMSLSIPATQTAGGWIYYTVRATDGGTQVATESGAIQFLATANSVTCTVQTTLKLHLGTVNSGCTPGFFNPSSQPGVSIFDNVTFSSPAALAVNEVYFRVEIDAGANFRIEP